MHLIPVPAARANAPKRQTTRTPAKIIRYILKILIRPFCDLVQTTKL